MAKCKALTGSAVKGLKGSMQLLFQDHSLMMLACQFFAEIL